MRTRERQILHACVFCWLASECNARSTSNKCCTRRAAALSTSHSYRRASVHTCTPDTLTTSPMVSMHVTNRASSHLRVHIERRRVSKPRQGWPKEYVGIRDQHHLFRPTSSRRGVNSAGNAYISNIQARSLKSVWMRHGEVWCNDIQGRAITGASLLCY